VENIKMTVAQWAEVLDNPRQRNTVAHAAKASRKHLKTASQAQARVSAARLPGGDLVKLDGHTRSLLWSTEKLRPPSAVHVDVYAVKSMEEAKELYTHFDGTGPTENAPDRLFGAFREAGIQPESGLLTSCMHTSALRNLGERDSTIYQTVKAWKRELQLLDGVGAGNRALGAGMFMGALCALRARGDRAIPFISAVVRDAGVRDDQGSDGVDAIVRHAKDRKGRGGGEVEIKDTAGRFITAFEGWLSGRRFRQVVRPTDFAAYLESRSQNFRHRTDRTIMDRPGIGRNGVSE
jgi:hypothetical protein